MKPSEISRMVRAVQATGLPVCSVEFPSDGLVRVNIGEPDKVDQTDREREKVSG